VYRFYDSDFFLKNQVPSADKPTIKSASEPNSVNPPRPSLLRIVVYLSTSFQFALALHLSNLNDARRVRSFLLLPFHRAFDPSLAFVAGGALPIGLFLYHFARGDELARLGGTTKVKSDKIDTRLLVGSAIFGLGWGMTGICRKLTQSILIYRRSYFRANCV
jgi:hypothetical protein